jgi:hypothetical protein
MQKMKIQFEDVGESEHGHWARVCHKHSLDSVIQSLGGIDCEYTSSGEAQCDVLGCRNKAAYYIDFFKWDPAIQMISREKNDLTDC